MTTACCDLSTFVKAIADETRQHILLLLQTGELNESDIVAHFHLTQPTVSYHLALLRRANLVLARREGNEVFFHANSAYVSECCSEIQARFNVHPQETRNDIPREYGGTPTT